MTQENKETLLKVLSEQFSYGVLILDTAAEKYGKLYQINSDSVWYDCQETGDVECQTIFNVKPYLRPMSSMTDEERDEFRTVGGVMSHDVQNDTLAICAIAPEAYDWLNAHHFDYRIVPSTGKTLIESGLALKAPMDMYNTSTTTRNAKPRPN